MNEFTLESPTASEGRREGDRYYTPPKLAGRLVKLLDLPPRSMVLEPSCGGGSFVRHLIARGCYTYAIDIDGDAVGLNQAHHARIRDFEKPLPAEWPAFDAVVGNPPFSRAREHVERALEVV